MHNKDNYTDKTPFFQYSADYMVNSITMYIIHEAKPNQIGFVIIIYQFQTRKIIKMYDLWFCFDYQRIYQRIVVYRAIIS